MVFADRVALLEGSLARGGPLLVALSGGVDSAALLAVAARALPGRVWSATTRSPAVPTEEIEDAAQVAALLGVPHRILDTRELDDPGYRANAGDRCYFCRREMYGSMLALARRLGAAALADGLQADDVVDDRPGVRAAGEHGVRHPLREHGFTKVDVRRLALAFGLPVQDKPAQPCLASRLPVGLRVTEQRLRRIHRAESALRELGFRELRVRDLRDHARVEIGARELGRALAARSSIEGRVVEAGFLSATLDPGGYRAGGAGRVPPS